MNFRTKISLVAIVLGLLFISYKVFITGILPQSTTHTAVAAQKTPDEILLDAKLKQIETQYADEQDCIRDEKQAEETSSFQRFVNYVKPYIPPSITSQNPPPTIHTEPQVQARVTYSSFLSRSDGRCAILNGVATYVGKKVFDTPYTVKKIDPNFVILTAPDGHHYKIKFKQATK